MKTFTAHSSVVPALLILRANAAITSRVLARVRRLRGRELDYSHSVRHSFPGIW